MSGRTILALVMGMLLSATLAGFVALDAPRTSGWARDAAAWSLAVGRERPYAAGLLGLAAGALLGGVVGRHWPAAKK